MTDLDALRTFVRETLKDEPGITDAKMTDDIHDAHEHKLIDEALGFVVRILLEEERSRREGIEAGDKDEEIDEMRRMRAAAQEAVLASCRPGGEQ